MKKKRIIWWLAILALAAFAVSRCQPGPESEALLVDCPEGLPVPSGWNPENCEYPRPLPPGLAWFGPLQPFFDSIMQNDAYASVSEDTLILLDSALVLLEPYAGGAYNFTKAHLFFLKGDLENDFPEKAIAELHKAEKWLEQSSALLKDSCYRHYQSSLHNRIGLVYTELSDLDNAVANFKKAIQLAHLTGIPKELASNYTNMGNAFQNAGEFSQAIEWHEKALCTMKTLREYSAVDTADLAWTHNNIGVALGYKADSLETVGARHTAENYREQAFAHLRRCLAIRGGKTGNPSLISAHAFARINIAFQFTKLQSPSAPDSIRHYTESCLELCRKYLGGVPGNLQAVANRHLAYAYMLEGECGKAVELIDTAIEMQKWREEETGRLLIKNKDHYSNFLFSKGAILTKCAEQDPGELSYLQQSLRAYLDAITFSEKTRRELATDVSLEGFLRPRIYQFSPAFEVAVKLHEATGSSGYLDSAFQVAERSRGFTLRQGIIRQVLKWQNDEQSVNLLRTELSFRKKILALEKEAANNPGNLDILSALQAEKEKFARFVNEIKNSTDRKKRKFYANRFDDSVPSIKTVQDLFLDDSTAVVEYMIGFERLWSLAITKDSALVASTAIDSSFYGLIEDYVNGLAMDKGDHSGNAWKIYQAVFQQVDAQLTSLGIKNILIIPDKQLQEVLFEAMLDAPDATPGAFGNYGYLIKRYNIGYHYSMAGLLSNRRLAQSRPPARKPFAGFTSGLPDPTLGAVSCGRTRLSELEKVTEQTRISYFPESGDFFAGAQDSAFTTQAGQYSILQLALHGCSSPGGNSEFFLEFRPKPGNEENHLELPEIYSLDLFSQLAVLSNCHTARGRHVSGEGIMSISRAFAYAGCPNIIGTLSSVPDQSTAQILEFFYEYLLEEGDPAFVALAKAKRRYQAQNNRHAWYWNNLIHLGDILPIKLKATNTPG
ncbi:MAG: CHAT domain-containing protein [Phaeodactylibacter sp.]|nr:CHAT domain-containing protein [Phaeodactylibacter sp.]MCB9298919.1 CHAT domain-containing protein [Lewinellaceae bacterium]